MAVVEVNLDLIGSDGTVHYSAPEGHPEVEKWEKEVVDRNIQGYEFRTLVDSTNWVDPLTCKTSRFKLYYSCKLSGLRNWVPFSWQKEADLNNVLRGVCAQCQRKCQFDRTKDVTYDALKSRKPTSEKP